MQDIFKQNRKNIQEVDRHARTTDRSKVCDTRQLNEDTFIKDKELKHTKTRKHMQSSNV